MTFKSGSREDGPVGCRTYHNRALALERAGHDPPVAGQSGANTLSEMRAPVYHDQ
jgi:hypothetical protein